MIAKHYQKPGLLCAKTKYVYTILRIKPTPPLRSQYSNFLLKYQYLQHQHQTYNEPRSYPPPSPPALPPSPSYVSALSLRSSRTLLTKRTAVRPPAAAERAYPNSILLITMIVLTPLQLSVQTWRMQVLNGHNTTRHIIVCL